MRKCIALAFLVLLLTGCTVKQGELVIIKEGDDNASKVQNAVLEQFSTAPQVISIEKNIEAIKKANTDLLPLAVSPDGNLVFAFEFLKNTDIDNQNSSIIAGNVVQEINFYVIKVNNNPSTKLLGKFLSIRYFQFDDTGKHFAFIDGSNNIYVYDLESESLQKVIEGKQNIPYNSLSWSKDSKRLMINTKMDFDIASRQFISIAVNSYTPFIKCKYNKDSYIVQMKNDDYSDFIALYDFSSKAYTAIATGIFMDSDNFNVIYTKNNMNNLNIVNLSTLESKLIDSGPIYCAYILKSTGDVLYTTLNPRSDSENKYILVKIDAESSFKTTTEVASPTFYLSPNESKAYFICAYGENSITANLANLELQTSGNKSDPMDLAKIKETILKMFQLDYTFSGSYENYEAKAKEIYANTYDIVPQEALENKLIDFRRFNMPLPNAQKDAYLPPSIILNTINIQNDHASINLGFYYINSVELVKTGEKWFITGFSTHPESREEKIVKTIVQKHLSDIQSKNKIEALKYWSAKTDNANLAAQRKIVDELLNNANHYTFEIGEIELWSSIDPHRVESPESCTAAKVKIIIRDKTNTYKYKLTLSRNLSGDFVISGWNTDPLSISQLY